MGRPHVAPPLTHYEALARILHTCNLGPEYADRVVTVLYALAPDRMHRNAAAARFGVSPDTIKALYKTGQLKAYNAGTGKTQYLMFASEDLARCFATSYVPGTPQPAPSGESR